MWRELLGQRSNIYNTFLDVFVTSVTTMRIERVALVAPFSTCFNSKATRTVVGGLDVPTIDLVLESSSVYWRIYRHNSLMRVKKDVMCLAFVDGGLRPWTPIVIRRPMLDNNSLEFDLAS
ncbi:hypothetical protein SLA2020_024640 [Shorea laevis]